MGYAVVTFTITETGTVENAKPLEGACGDPTNPETVFRPCSILIQLHQGLLQNSNTSLKLLMVLLELMMFRINLLLFSRKINENYLDKSSHHDSSSILFWIN